MDIYDLVNTVQQLRTRLDALENNYSNGFQPKLLTDVQNMQRQITNLSVVTSVQQRIISSLIDRLVEDGKLPFAAREKAQEAVTQTFTYDYNFSSERLFALADEVAQNPVYRLGK